MDNKVNISQIAREVGVSVSTVSRALSGSGRISDATRQKINEYLATKELIPNTREKRYTDVTTKMISVVLPGEENFAYMPYFLTVFLSVYDYFSIRGYQVSLIKITPTDISNLIRAVEAHVMDDNLCMGILRLLRKMKIDVPGDIKVALSLIHI